MKRVAHSEHRELSPHSKVAFSFCGALKHLSAYHFTLSKNNLIVTLDSLSLVNSIVFSHMMQLFQRKTPDMSIIVVYLARNESLCACYKAGNGAVLVLLNFYPHQAHLDRYCTRLLLLLTCNVGISTSYNSHFFSIVKREKMFEWLYCRLPPLFSGVGTAWPKCHSVHFTLSSLRLVTRWFSGSDGTCSKGFGYQ